MTISSSVVKSGPYSGNDVTTSFAYSFQIFADADLQVVHTDSSDVETVLTLDVDYSVSGAGDAAGGSITYPVSGTPLATGEKLTIVSNLTAEQQTDLSNQGGFFPEVHETVFDKLCRLIQQAEEKLTRAVLAPLSSSTLPTDLYASLIAAAASAASSAASALATWTTFDNKYLGSYASNPTTLNDGVTALDASHDGIEFWDSTLKVRKTWNGGTLTWGLTSTSVATNAVDVNISDAGSYFSGVEVETALQEVGYNLLLNTTKLSYGVNVKDFGAVGDGVTDDTTAIQNGIDYCYTNSIGILYFPSGTYMITAAGIHSGYNYGLMLKSGVILKGESYQSTIIKASNNSDMDLIITNRTSATVNTGIIDIKVDGNFSNQTAGRFNIWLYDVDNVVIDKLHSINPYSWGIRLQSATNLFSGLIKCDHGAISSADGVHLLDCSYVVMDKVIVSTTGDDGFIIGAENDDSHDISVGELVITTPVTTAAAGRGILFHVEGTTQRSIYNVTIANAITYNCKGSALEMTDAQYRNINVTLSDYGSLAGLTLSVGNASFAGYVRNCSFNIKSWNPTGQFTQISITDGAIENNHINFQGYNPADGSVGVSLIGDYWTGDIDVNYDPTATKVSPSFAMDVYGSYNNIRYTSNAGTVGINLRAGALNNTFNLGSITGATASIAIASGSNYNKFVGGYIDSAPTNSGSFNQFIGVTGANAYGSTTINPTTNGNDTIAHGLITQPVVASVRLRGDTVNSVDIQAFDGTNLTVRVKDASGADVTSGSFTAMWDASL